MKYAILIIKINNAILTISIIAILDKLNYSPLGCGYIFTTNQSSCSSRYFKRYFHDMYSLIIFPYYTVHDDFFSNCIYYYIDFIY